MQSHTSRYKQNELGIPRIIVLFFPKADNAILLLAGLLTPPFFRRLPIDFTTVAKIAVCQSRFFTGVPFSSRNLVVFREPDALQM
jgi:hypothetical protein